MADLSSPCGLRVVGAWTKSGLGSCIQVKSQQNHNFLFDCGVSESQTSGARQVFISHGHTDHIGAVILHARGKGLSSDCSTYYVPQEALEPLQDAVNAFSRLDGKTIAMNLVAVNPGDVISLGKGLIVRVFPTIHRVASQGYAVFSQKRGRLLPEYRDVPPKDVWKLRQSNVPIFEPDIETIEMVYTGDTTFEGLLLPGNYFVFQAPVLIMELTYLDGDRSSAIKYTHVHIDDVVECAELFENVKTIVFCHISPKYAPCSRIIDILRRRLPPCLLQKSMVNMKSFGANDWLSTVLSDVDIEERRREVGWGWGTPASGGSGSKYGGGSAGSGGSGRGDKGGRGDGGGWGSGSSSSGRDGTRRGGAAGAAGGDVVDRSFDHSRTDELTTHSSSSTPYSPTPYSPLAFTHYSTPPQGHPHVSHSPSRRHHSPYNSTSFPPPPPSTSLSRGQSRSQSPPQFRGGGSQSPGRGGGPQSQPPGRGGGPQSQSQSPGRGGGPQSQSQVHGFQSRHVTIPGHHPQDRHGSRERRIGVDHSSVRGEGTVPPATASDSVVVDGGGRGGGGGGGGGGSAVNDMNPFEVLNDLAGVDVHRTKSPRLHVGESDW